MSPGGGCGRRESRRRWSGFHDDTQLTRGAPMALRLGDTAPNFTADTTEGEIDFYDWKGDSWAVLFSHPADYTPVCTTELGYMAKIKPEFDQRNTKILAVSVD